MSLSSGNEKKNSLKKNTKRRSFIVDESDYNYNGNYADHIPGTIISPLTDEMKTTN